MDEMDEMDVMDDDWMLGPMVWYQLFEYAIGHWLQKATEHMIGCVLCSPGCFSLFRGKALMDDNVMRRYTTKSDEARHYVQYDQGEDRWLCTLLLQRGYRVEYSAASDAYTHCPEGFNEFFQQRRRWVPSTMANIMDLLGDYKRTIQINDNISLPYIFYQVSAIRHCIFLVELKLNYNYKCCVGAEYVDGRNYFGSWYHFPHVGGCLRSRFPYRQLVQFRLQLVAHSHLHVHLLRR